jgi:hypothetical protein
MKRSETAFDKLFWSKLGPTKCAQRVKTRDGFHQSVSVHAADMAAFYNEHSSLFDVESTAEELN